MKENPLQKKSYEFALLVISIALDLGTKKKEYVISKQLLKSGTSIGANIEEAIGGQSEKDFQAKMAIAYKEARETNFWLKLLRDSKLLTEKQLVGPFALIDELLKMLGSVQHTMNTKIQK